MSASPIEQYHQRIEETRKHQLETTVKAHEKRHAEIVAQLSGMSKELRRLNDSVEKLENRVQKLEKQSLFRFSCFAFAGLVFLGKVFSEMNPALKNGE
ncbi:MAG: hypothetical protein KGJ02_04040 [Verrucomicrobiota bacterium]|nr:hypothetical protein [Verrucomicrobiota bacterium]